ncbi:MAG TPA: hypothetical protein VK809_05370, partial [Bacteroidia bacterium]|nr:hypothetical protein [Bacteroidia bacterium]
NRADYSISDPSGVQAVRDAGITATIGSIETTHGIIKLASDAKFAFISGITDRFTHFNDDVNGKDVNGNIKTEAQNYAAAFNIGVYLASALPKIVTIL